MNQEQLVDNSDFQLVIKNTSFSFIKISKPFKQQLTHQKIIAIFWEITVDIDSLEIPSSFLRVNKKNIPNFAFPKIIDWYLKDKALYLELH